MITRISIALASLLFSACLFAAITLDAAKQQGLVGEQLNGYLGAVNSTSEVQALIKDINAKRKKAYLKIAKKNQLTLDQVAALAAKKAIEKTPAGQYVQRADGSWTKK